MEISTNAWFQWLQECEKVHHTSSQEVAACPLEEAGHFRDLLTRREDSWRVPGLKTAGLVDQVLAHSGKTLAGLAVLTLARWAPDLLAPLVHLCLLVLEWFHTICLDRVHTSGEAELQQEESLDLASRGSSSNNNKSTSIKEDLLEVLQ